MKNKPFEEPDLVIHTFEIADILTTSDDTWIPGEDELPGDPLKL